MSPHISLRAEEIFHIGSFAVTNALLLSTLSALVLLVAGFALRRKLTLVPQGFQNAAEAAVEGLLGLMDSVLGNRHHSERYLPLVATIFLFILFSNWLGLVPGVGSLILKEGAYHRVPLLRPPAADLNFTLGLAITAVLAVNILGVAAVGFFRHGKKYFNFSNPITFFIGLLEFISEFAKMISFSFRLFGNVFAGEVLLVIMAFLVPYLVPLPFLFLELFVGFIQAFIFAMLTLVFVAAAVAENH